MSKTTIPRNLRNLLINLDFFGSTPEGNKPCISDMSYVSQSSFIGALKRWYLGESKDNLIRAIEELTTEALEAISSYENNIEYLKLILNSLVNFNLGIKKIRQTYTGFPRHRSSIKICSQSITLQLKKYKNLIPDNIDDLEEIEIESPKS